MPDHEPLDAAERDEPSGEKHEMRAARAAAVSPRGRGTKNAGTDSDWTVPSDVVEAASEPMVLERLPDDATAPTPPGRQRTGDPPAA